jgi:hypothetical protein
MSTVPSIYVDRRYGPCRACAASGASAGRGSTIAAGLRDPAALRRRPGPQGPMSDAALVAEIRAILAASPFHGEGYRKVWARLHHKGVRTSNERVRRLMREQHLSADTGRATPRGPQTMTARDWSERNGVRLRFIEPGKPVQNAFIESLNGKLRDQYLNLHWFRSLRHAPEEIEQWRQHYNTEHPHSALGYRTQMEVLTTHPRQCLSLLRAPRCRSSSGSNRRIPPRP